MKPLLDGQKLIKTNTLKSNVKKHNGELQTEEDKLHWS